MQNKKPQSLVSFSLLPDRFSIVRTEGGAVTAAASRELVQPFTLESFREQELSLNSYTEVISNLYARAGGDVKNAGVTIGSDMVLIKKLPVNLGLSEELIEEHMKWEAEQCLVSQSGDYIIDYQRLPITSDDGNPQYVLILVRRIVVDQLRSVFRSLDLSLRDIDIHLFSLVRLLTSTNDLSGYDPYCLIDVQRSCLTMVIMLQKEYYLSHKISLGRGGYKDAVSPDEDIADLIQKELKRILFGHRLGEDISVVKKIFLTGSEEVRNICDALNQRHMPESQVVNPFQNIALKADSNTDSPEFFSAALGAALKQRSIRMP